jgi:hypothetical protein
VVWGSAGDPAHDMDALGVSGLPLGTHRARPEIEPRRAPVLHAVSRAIRRSRAVAGRADEGRCAVTQNDPLPELQEGDLDAEALKQLVADIGQHGTLLDISIKGGRTDRANAVPSSCLGCRVC